MFWHPNEHTVWDVGTTILEAKADEAGKEHLISTLTWLFKANVYHDMINSKRLYRIL